MKLKKLFERKNKHPEPSSQQPISADLQKNTDFLNQLLDVGPQNFDIIFREWQFGSHKAASYNINSMVNDDLLSDILENVTLNTAAELSPSLFKKVFYQKMTTTQVELVSDMQTAIIDLLSGMVIVIIDGLDQMIAIDTRKYPARMPAESNIEKVTRGSRDSFVETLVFNTVLIRRRVRDPMLRFEILKVGTRSQTDVVIAYIKDIANPSLVKKVKAKCQQIHIDGIPMAEKAMEEYLVGGWSWNPLPKVRYTERPDVAAVHLLEGHVCIMTDNSPNLMILPTTIFHHIQHIEEYHQNPLIGTWMRLVRLLGIVLSLLLPPVWLALVLSRHMLPESLAFLGPRDPGIIPLGIQFILAEVGVELVRMATIHVPSAQSTALGFIGAFMLGEFATKVGLFGNETVFYTAIAAVGSFATPSMELSMVMRVGRVFLLLLVMLFKLPGLAIGLVLMAILSLGTKSFGVPYMWPLFPLNFMALRDMVFRLPIPEKSLRPAFLKPLDPDRLEDEGSEGSKEEQ